MKKRDFLAYGAVSAAGAAGVAATAAQAQAPAAAARTTGPTLLTVTGAIAKPNRGPFDPVLDQMMGKQKLAFDKARTFDFASLAAMPAVTIQPTLEYDRKKHKLQGPLLTTVLRAAGAGANGKLAMRAIDGYAPSITMDDAAKLRYIVATHLDGKPMPLGGLGPLWAVYEPDGFADIMAKPIDQRFALCPWGLYHIDVQG